MWLYFMLVMTSALLATTRAEVDISLSEIPSCSLGCIESAFTSGGFSLTNEEALCRNNTLELSLAACIQESCDFTDQLKAITINQQLCKGVPIESQSMLFSVTEVVLGSLSLIAIVMRCYSRVTITREFGYDDMIIVVVGFLEAALLGVSVANCDLGLGLHIWDVNPRNISTVLKIFWVAELFYVVASTLIRTSLLIFYLRIFPNQGFRVANYITLAVVLSLGTAISLTVIFQCTPIAGVWNRTLDAKCVAQNTVAYILAGASIALDILVLSLPIPQVLSLKTRTRRKISLIIMFSFGSLACVMSMVRLKFLVHFLNSYDQTWDDIAPGLWSLAELCAATICACLPAIRILLAQWSPRLFPNLSALEVSNPSPTPQKHTNSILRPRPGFRHIRSRSSNKFHIDRELQILGLDTGRAEETEIWAPKASFYDVESLVASPTVTKSSSASSPSEILVLQGTGGDDDEDERKKSFPGFEGVRDLGKMERDVGVVNANGRDSGRNLLKLVPKMSETWVEGMPRSVKTDTSSMQVETGRE